MPCNATSQLTNAPSVPLQVTMPTNNAQWAVFVQRLQDAINATRDAANRQPVNVVPVAYAVYNGSSLPALTVTGATAALDATKAQFGKASLKLTATAATVTVSFTGNPIVIQPFARWIESVYITSSRAALTGTLAVVTAVKSYPVDISGTLIPATWGRLYGDCALTADASTSATLALTLTGCAVGDIFNLEGWQLEQSAGTSLPSPFVNTAAPADYVVTVQNVATAQTTANTANANTPNVINPQFANGAIGWTLQQGWAVAGGAATFTGFAGAVNNAIYNTRLVPVTPGQQVTVQAMLTANGAAGTCGTCVAWFDSTGTWKAFSSRGAAVTGTAAATLSRAVAVVPANIAYAAAAADVWSGTAGTFTADDFILTPALSSLDELPAGAIYGHVIQQSISETVDNAGFELPLDAQGNIPGWTPANAALSLVSFGYTGSQCLRIIPTTAYGGAVSTRMYACAPGDVYALFGAILSDAGNTGYLQWAAKNASGAQVGAGVAFSNSTNAWAYGGSQFTIPSGAAYFVIFPAASVVGSEAYFDAIKLSRVRSLDSEVQDGATYSRILGSQLTSGVHNLEIAGSGHQVGDQLNLPPISSLNLKYIWPNAPTYTANAGSPATATISVPATNVIAGSKVIAYHAMSVGVTGTGGTIAHYFLYVQDPTYSGGSKTLIATTNSTDVYSNNGNVFVGGIVINFPTTGTGTGTGGGGGGTGGKYPPQ